MGETISVDIESDPVADPANELDQQVEKLQRGGGEEPTNVQPEVDGESLLAGKFSSQEDLEKAYLELQQKLGGQQTESPEASSTDPAFQISKEGQEEAAKEAFNAEKYQQEFMEQGTLSDESVKEIKALGVPDEMIETHMAGLQAIKEARASAILNMFGDKGRMEQVLAWAGNNLSEGEITAIENQANSTDMGTCETAIKGLVARFDSSPMGQTNPLEGQTGGSSIQPFKSNAEMVEAMNDPRYDKDEGYRTEVAARMR